MSFKKLFDKNDKKVAKQEKLQQILIMLDQKIKELELRIDNIETKTKALFEEAKAKFKAGDRKGTKNILIKKRKLYEQIKQIENTIAMMEDQKMILDSVHTCRLTLLPPSYYHKSFTDSFPEDLEAVIKEIENYKVDQEESNEFFKEYDQEDIEEEMRKLEEEIALQETQALSGIKAEPIGLVPDDKNKEEDDISQFLAV